MNNNKDLTDEDLNILMDFENIRTAEQQALEIEITNISNMSLEQVKNAGIVASKILELKRKEKDFLSSLEELVSSYEFCEIKDYFDKNKLRQSVKVQQDNK